MVPARILLLLGLIPILGCSGATLSSSSDLEQEIRELKARVIELQRKAAVSEVEMTRLRSQLMDLEARTGGSAGSTSAGASRSEVSPRVEEPRPAEDSPPPTLPVAVAVVEETDLDDDSPTVSTVDLFEEAPAASPSGDPPAAELPDAGQALYDRGYTLYHQGEYLDAEAAFLRFLESFADSDLADNAQYWIGECRFSRQDLRGALSAFRETINRYPEGNKVPDALLKSGQVLEELGDESSARASYREVQRRFPQSAAAVVASERLKTL